MAELLNVAVGVGVAPRALLGCVGAELAPTADAPPPNSGCSPNVASAPTHAAILMILVVMASPGKLHTQRSAAGGTRGTLPNRSADM